LRSKKQQVEELGPGVPAYIVTFSDMVTLLLTFFVMLLSLAKMQDPELVNVGRDGFVSSLRNCGLGLLTGRRQTTDFGESKMKYYISNSDKDVEVRTIDAKQENVRRLFSTVTRSMQTLPSQIVAEKNSFSVTEIKFRAGDATLNGSAKTYLTKFLTDMRPQRGGIEQLYVLGLAQGEADERKQWLLSAKRASAVAEYMNEMMPKGANFRIFSWGAGSGGVWVGRDSPISAHAEILIAILRNSS
jgi:chemotaxis protein MotB